MTGMEMLQVIVNVLLAVLLVFLIYFVITLTNSIKRLTVQSERLLKNTNDLVDDVNFKMSKLNTLFEVVDSVSAKFDYVNDKVSTLYLKAINYITEFISNIFNKSKDTKIEDGEIYE